DGVLGAAEPLDALNPDGGRARAFDLRAHFDKQLGEVGDLRLAGGVAQDGLAAGQHGGHHEVLGAGDGDAVEVHRAAAESAGRLGFDIAVLLVDGGAELFEAEDVQVDRAGADGATAGEGDAGAAAARDEGPQDETRRAHRLYELVGRFGADDLPGVQPHRLAGYVAGGADVDEEALHRADIADAGDAMQRDRILGEQRGGKSWQRGVLRS